MSTCNKHIILILFLYEYKEGDSERGSDNDRQRGGNENDRFFYGRLHEVLTVEKVYSAEIQRTRRGWDDANKKDESKKKRQNMK